MIDRLSFNRENTRVKEEVAKTIKYILEEKFLLEQEIRAGEEAKRKLKDNEDKLVINMVAYLAIKDGGINEMS